MGLDGEGQIVSPSGTNSPPPHPPHTPPPLPPLVPKCLCCANTDEGTAGRERKERFAEYCFDCQRSSWANKNGDKNKKEKGILKRQLNFRRGLLDPSPWRRHTWNHRLIGASRTSIPSHCEYYDYITCIIMQTRSVNMLLGFVMRESPERNIRIKIYNDVHLHRRFS